MSIPAAGILCAHLVDKDGLTFYLVSEFPPTGLCGICFSLYGRAVESIPRENLEVFPLALFERRKAKSYPVYNRIIDRRIRESL